MAYVTGSAANLAALLTSIRSACTANGWTLSGEVLHKGAVFQRLAVNGNFIDSLGGTGKDGSNNLTGQPAANSQSRIGTPTGAHVAPLAFPVTYRVFIGTAPDEVFVVVNYSTDFYQWLAWGQSSVVSLGTGGWFSGSFDAVAGYINGINLGSTLPLGYRNSSLYACPALFHADYGGAVCGEHVNHGIGATTNGWNAGASTPNVQAASYRAPLDACLPSAWNSETVLLPIQAFTDAYGSAKVAMVLDVAHARAVRIDNHQPGDIITLGADRWMLFPWYHKSATETATSTGRLGWAIRYDGP